MNRVSRSIPNYLIRLVPPLAVHNRLPYAIEIKVASIKYEVRIEAGEKASIYFLNLLKSHKITVEVSITLKAPNTNRLIAKAFSVVRFLLTWACRGLGLST